MGSGWTKTLLLRLLLSRRTNWDWVGCVLALAVLIFGTRTDLGAQVSVRIAWDPNPETNISGYRIYYGRTNPGSVTNMVDVGRQTSGTVANLAYSADYFFYVTAYNTFQLESDPSAPLTYRTPGPLSLSMDGRLIVLAPSQFTLRPRLTGYKPPGTDLIVSWRETSSSGVPIQGANTLTPQITVTTPGTYDFELSVNAGSAQFVTATSVLAINGIDEPNRGDTIVLSYLPLPLEDLVYFYWNARSDRSYAFTYTRHLGDRTWVPITLFYPAYTDHVVSEAWLAERESVFFFVLEQR